MNFRPLTRIPTPGDQVTWINRSEKDPILWYVEVVNGNFVRITDKPTRPHEINHGWTFCVPMTTLMEPVPGTGNRPVRVIARSAAPDAAPEPEGIRTATTLADFLKVAKTIKLSKNDVERLTELVNTAPNNGQRVMRGRNFLRNIAKKVKP